METLIVVGDPHLKRKYINRSIEMLRKIEEITDLTNPTLGVLLLGDTFDEHNVVHNECITAYSDFVGRMTKKTKVYHLLGNHEMNDSYTFLPKIHTLNAWKGMENLFIIDVPTSFEFGNTKVAMLPYCPTGDFSRALEMLPNVPDIVMCHQEFSGCNLGGFHASEHGDPLPEIAVISGHVHGEQTLGNVWYPGTPVQHGFGEDENKYIYLIGIENGGYKVLEKFDLGLPKFITVNCSCDEVEKLKFDFQHFYRLKITDERHTILKFKQTDIYKKMQKLCKITFNTITTEVRRKEENSQPQSFEVKFFNAVKEQNLVESYQDFFREFQESLQ